MHVTDTTSYFPKWLATLITVVLAGLATIANVITAMAPSGAWLGLSDVTWHWVLIVCAALVAINAAINRAVLTLAPTAKRKVIEHELDKHERALKQDPQLHNL